MLIGYRFLEFSYLVPAMFGRSCNTSLPVQSYRMEALKATDQHFLPSVPLWHFGLYFMEP